MGGGGDKTCDILSLVCESICRFLTFDDDDDDERGELCKMENNNQRLE